ncbi:MAG: hypothetical protein F7C09_06380 [Aeropyrum sp.]|nr:hypothetical protein [Aeropyrum sp.]
MKLASIPTSGQYYAILSSENWKLSIEELKAVLDVETQHYRLLAALDGLAVFDSSNIDLYRVVGRAAYTKEIGILLGLAGSSHGCVSRLADRAIEVLETAKASSYERESGFWVFSEDRGPYIRPAGSAELSREIIRRAARLGFRLDKRTPLVSFRAFSTEGVLALGVVVARQEGKGYLERSPGRRPFFKPGPLSPRLSRAFVNLSRLRAGEVFMDPFCGTGGFALEACMVGASIALCGDLDWRMVEGGPENLKRYCPHGTWVYSAWNAGRLPIRSKSIYSIATDPPYGRSTTTGGVGYTYLVREMLRRSRDILVDGGWVAFAGPHFRRPEVIATSEGFAVETVVEMFVHGSLTRSIVVARIE